MSDDTPAPAPGDDEELAWEDIPQFLEEFRGMARRLLHRDGGRNTTLDSAELLQTSLRRWMSHEISRERTWTSSDALLAYAWGLIGNTLKKKVRDRNALKREADRKDARAIEDISDQALASLDLVVDVVERAEATAAYLAALDTLRAHSPDLYAVAQCRKLMGFKDRETATLLNVDEKTVARRWARAHAMLIDEVRRSLGDAPP